MKKTAKKAWTDVVLLLQMVALAATGVVVKWVLPPGSGGGRGWQNGGRGWHGGHQGWGPETFLGMSRHEWGDVHFWISVTLVAVLLLHLALHWKWIVCRAKALFARRDGEACEAAAAEDAGRALAP